MSQSVRVVAESAAVVMTQREHRSAVCILIDGAHGFVSPHLQSEGKIINVLMVWAKPATYRLK